MQSPPPSGPGPSSAAGPPPSSAATATPSSKRPAGTPEATSRPSRVTRVPSAPSSGLTFPLQPDFGFGYLQEGGETIAHRFGSGATLQTQRFFTGFGAAAFYKLLMNGFKLWNDTPERMISFFKGAAISAEVAPELLGVGYIIGTEISCVMVAGGVLASWVLIPAIKLFGDGLAAPLFPAVKLIHDMSATTQFVVITHSKRTMAQADVIYGVTMQEPGVSKIVSVNLGKNNRSRDERRVA